MLKSLEIKPKEKFRRKGRQYYKITKSLAYKFSLNVPNNAPSNRSAHLLRNTSYLYWMRINKNNEDFQRKITKHRLVSCNMTREPYTTAQKPKLLMVKKILIKKPRTVPNIMYRIRINKKTNTSCIYLLMVCPVQTMRSFDSVWIAMPWNISLRWIDALHPRPWSSQ